MTTDQPVPEFLRNKELRLIILGGKGGVGKTTMAAASALHLAVSSQDQEKVLIISTDPAHSLSDSFDMPVGDKITPIQGLVSNDQCPMTNLFAHELDASKLLQEFKLKNDAIMKKLADRGTYFDQQDIAEFFDLSLPGMDEVMAIIEIANLLKKGTYEVLILDTAPTGHTVRMLNLPEQMRKWIEVMDLMQHKHRYMATHFTGRKYVKDECDIFLDDLSADIDRVKKMLSNVETTRFVPVTIPEPMSIYETNRLIGSLEKLQVPVKEIIINRVMDSGGCSFCSAKMADQEGPIAEIEDHFSKYDLIKVGLFPNEIRGLEGLKWLADYLIGMPKPFSFHEAIQVDEMPDANLTIEGDLEFILFGGKGGVGKTSLASAAALHLAQKRPEKRVLVFSTDPAHSLSDSFGIEIGDKITPIQWSVTKGQKSEVRSQRSEVGGQGSVTNYPTLQSPITNLFALEINADELWQDFKADFKRDIEEIFDAFMAKGADIVFDREVMTELLTLAPPGLDEIMALDRIMELREQGEFDIFVLDTSPTGHLLRFLELPDLVREWLKSFFRLLLKYKGVVRLTKAAERALSMSKNIRKIQETLADPKRTSFIAVTIPEAMGYLELERLVSAVEKARIPLHHIAVNMFIPATDCDFCSSKRVEQQIYIKKIHTKYSHRAIIKVPLFTHNISGKADLNKIGQIVFGNGNPKRNHQGCRTVCCKNLELAPST